MPIKQLRAHPERLRDRPDEAAATSLMRTWCQCLTDELPGAVLPPEVLSSASDKRRKTPYGLC